MNVNEAIIPKLSCLTLRVENDLVQVELQPLCSKFSLIEILVKETLKLKEHDLHPILYKHHDNHTLHVLV